MLRAEPSAIPRRGAGGFALLELLISLGIVALLLSMLLPLLSYARDTARTTLCASNLRQLATPWSLYLGEHRAFPQYPVLPDWNYGGAEFKGADGRPVLAADRPINAFLESENGDDESALAMLFRCPSDRGITLGRGKGQHKALGAESCFEFFGTSYRANPSLLDSTKAGIDDLARPLAQHDVEHVQTSRLLLMGDAEWYYATRETDNLERRYDASWHVKPDSGNMLAVDGSVRFVTFGPGEGRDYLLYPRPKQD